MTTAPLALSSIFYLAGIGVVLPLLAYSGKRKLDAGLRFPRIPFYVEAVILQTVLLVVSVFVARKEGIVQTFASLRLLSSNALVTWLFVAGALLAMWVSFKSSAPSSRERLALIVPFTNAERLMWVVVSLVAAVSEEVIYRGVTFGLLQKLSPGFWLPTLIAAAVFALAHVIQGWKNAMFVAVFAIGFHMLVRHTGSLHWAMTAHFIYDLVAGYLLGWVLSRPQQTSAALIDGPPPIES